MKFTVYLSGEIHTDWRENLQGESKNRNLDIQFLSPVTNHSLSDDCGVIIMGEEKEKFWYDHKGAKLNAIRTKTSIEKADLVIVRFGEKYKQWNAAFDAGYASALGKPLVIIHNSEHQHALKEIDAAALATTSNLSQVVDVLEYTLNGTLRNR